MKEKFVIKKHVRPGEQVVTTGVTYAEGNASFSASLYDAKTFDKYTEAADYISGVLLSHVMTSEHYFQIEKIFILK